MPSKIGKAIRLARVRIGFRCDRQPIVAYSSRSIDVPLDSVMVKGIERDFGSGIDSAEVWIDNRNWCVGKCAAWLACIDHTRRNVGRKRSWCSINRDGRNGNSYY